MKKIVTILFLLLCIGGCALTYEKPEYKVKEYLNKYNNLDASVLTELEKLMQEENLSIEQQEKYKEIMKKQYKDLKYEIQEEIYNGEEATIVTKVTVYDLYRVQKEAEEYRNNNRNLFLDEENKYDSNLFLDYKLDKMQKNTKTTEYTIHFKVRKQEDKWQLEDIKTEDLEKIHGIYNYTND